MGEPKVTWRKEIETGVRNVENTRRKLQESKKYKYRMSCLKAHVPLGWGGGGCVELIHNSEKQKK